MTAAIDLGMTLAELKERIADGAIVAVSAEPGQRLLREEMVAIGLMLWEQGEIGSVAPGRHPWMAVVRDHHGMADIHGWRGIGWNAANARA
jgi:hypothetical protein